MDATTAGWGSVIVAIVTYLIRTVRDERERKNGGGPVVTELRKLHECMRNDRTEASKEHRAIEKSVIDATGQQTTQLLSALKGKD